MTITYHDKLEQGSAEWLAARCGLLTASEMKHIVTPSLKQASNDKERAHVYEMLAQRITRYVEPHYMSDDMLRGHEDEIEARLLYAKNVAPVRDMGFVTNDRWGFRIGWSPDGLVGDHGAIECKSRRQKIQVETICAGTVPVVDMIQIQTGLLVSERSWMDYISYSGGLPAIIIRVHADTFAQSAIVEAARNFEHNVATRMADYTRSLTENRNYPTERRVDMEITL